MGEQDGHIRHRPVPSIEGFIEYAMLKYMVTLEEFPGFSPRTILSIGKQAYYVVTPCSIPSEKLFCEASRIAWRSLERLKSERLITATQPWGKTFFLPTEGARIVIESWEKRNEFDDIVSIISKKMKKTT
jgi:hypothetical protein